MILYANAVELIRKNLETIASGGKASPVIIGELTAKQIGELNAKRNGNGFPHEHHASIKFVGKHIYDSRCRDDNYSIDDVIEQITSAFSQEFDIQEDRRGNIFLEGAPRSDNYGNTRIRDRAVFECTSNHPKLELYSIIPKGDIKKPKKNGAS
jgi:hypothetical protein